MSFKSFTKQTTHSSLKHNIDNSKQHFDEVINVRCVYAWYANVMSFIYIIIAGMMVK